ncbi:MAG: DUF4136 domain-containing protein [Gammaproteobacteria bacterium]
MRTKMKIAISLLTIFLVGCAPRIYVEQDSQANLSELRSFAWIDDPEPAKKVDSPILDSELLSKRTRRAVIATLIEFGYEHVDVESADFHVTYHVSSQEQYYNRGPRFGFGVSTGRYHHGTSVHVGTGFGTYRGYEEGSLIIDIIDRASGELVWRGWQNKSVYQDAYSEEAVSKSVRLILDEFAYVEVSSSY